MLGPALRRLRGRRGLSLGDAEVLTGIPKSSLSEWESGRHRPHLSRLALFLDALGASPDERRRIAEAIGAGDRLIPPIRSETEPNRGFFGDGLRGLRLRRGLSQGQLAKRCGVSQPAVAKWESGDALPLDKHRERIIEALAITPQEADVLWRTEVDRPVWLRLSEAERPREAEFVFGLPKAIDFRHGILALLSAYHVALHRYRLDPAWADVELALAARLASGYMFSQRNSEFRAFTEAFWSRERRDAASRIELQELRVMVVVAELRTSSRVPLHRAYDLVRDAREFHAGSNHPWAAATASTILMEHGEVDLAHRQILFHLKAMESYEGSTAGALPICAGRLLELGFADEARAVLERNWHRHWLDRRPEELEPLGIFSTAARIMAATGNLGQADRLLNEGEKRAIEIRNESNATAIDVVLGGLSAARFQIEA